MLSTGYYPTFRIFGVERKSGNDLCVRSPTRSLAQPLRPGWLRRDRCRRSRRICARPGRTNRPLGRCRLARPAARVGHGRHRRCGAPLHRQAKARSEWCLATKSPRCSAQTRSCARATPLCCRRRVISRRRFGGTSQRRQRRRLAPLLRASRHTLGRAGRLSPPTLCGTTSVSR